MIETYGADAFEQVEACTLGVGEYGLDVVQVYPNPVGDVLHVRAKRSITSITVYDLLGQRVYASVPEAGALTDVVGMSGFASGLYLVRVSVGNRVETFKVLKE